MKKLKLYGIKKGDKHNVFSIEKKEIFLTNFIKFMIGLGFNSSEVKKELWKLLGDTENNYSKRKYSDKIYRDEYFYFENKMYRIDVFFGKEKIILSIFTCSDKQQKIMNLIGEFCDFE